MNTTQMRAAVIAYERRNATNRGQGALSAGIVQPGMEAVLADWRDALAGLAQQLGAYDVLPAWATAYLAEEQWLLQRATDRCAEQTATAHAA